MSTDAPVTSLCPACGAAIAPRAAFCAQCGGALVAPAGTVADPELRPGGSRRGRGARVEPHRRRRARLSRVDNRMAGSIAVGAGLLGAVASSLTWIRIAVAGRTGPGSVASGLDGRDGRTVLVVGALAAAVGLVLLAGRGDGWLKIALMIGGGIITVIAAVDIADVGAKAGTLEERFGIGRDVVSAEVGIGLWLVGGAGIGLLAAGLLARRAEPR